MDRCVASPCATPSFRQQIVQHRKHRSSMHWQRVGREHANLHLSQGSTPLRAAKPSAQPGENGASEGLSRVSPDVLKLFGETQRNLLELNRSRLNALDELREAKNKISELESQLEQASTQAHVPATTGHDAVQHSNAEPSREATPVSTSSSAALPAVITVAYRTGWNKVMMHYSADGQAWSGLPGVCMEDGQDEFANWKVLQVRGTRLEFVLTNGDGQWDTPDPYGTNQANRNYVIDAPGSYRLLSGRLSKVS